MYNYNSYNIEMQENIIRDLKELIRNDDIKELKLYYNHIINDNRIYNLNLEYIYKESLTYNCYYGSERILRFLLSLYNKFDDFSKIALRQMLFYCKYILIKQKKNITIIENFLETVRIK